MGRLRFAAGAFGIIVGFFVYQYGFYLTLKLSPTLFAWSVTLIPWIGSSELIGAVFQLVGGVLAIAGLLFCITWIGSQSREKRVTAGFVPPSQRESQILASRKCKFCGAAIESDAVFCPKCERAQA